MQPYGVRGGAAKGLGLDLNLAPRAKGPIPLNLDLDLAAINTPIVINKEESL